MRRPSGAGSSRWVVSVVAVVVVVGLVATAGVHLGDRHRSAGPSAGSAGSPAESARVRATAHRVYSSFAGTIEQRDAGLVLKAYHLNGGMDDCLESAGYPEWDWSKSRQYATPVDPLAVGTWLAEPNRPFRSEQLMAQRRGILAESSMNRGHISPGEDKAIGRCLNSPHRPDHPVRVGSIPKAANRLMEEWWAMVEGVASQAGPITKYEACMDNAHIPALVDSKLPASRLGEAISRLGPANSAIPSSPHDPKVKAPRWRAFLASEKQITDADWTCRAATYDGAMAKLGPEVEHFESAHAAEIRAAQTGWRQTQVQAKSVGYTGQVGPLGL